MTDKPSERGVVDRSLTAAHRVADKAWPWHPKGRPLQEVIAAEQGA